jgi:hypothetical protein
VGSGFLSWRGKKNSWRLSLKPKNNANGGLGITSVVDPDPVRAETFSRIRIRNEFEVKLGTPKT